MRLSLRKKAFLFFFLFEAVLLIVFGNMLVLYKQSEAESLREENAKKVVGNTEQLAFYVEAAGRGIAQYGAGNAAGLRKYDEAAAKVKELSEFLREQYEGKNSWDPQQKEAFARLYRTCVRLQEDFRTIRTNLDGMDMFSAVRMLQRERERVQPDINLLIQDGLRLVEQQKAVIDETPMLARRRREAWLQLMINGLLASSGLAGLTLIVFWRDVISRLKTMEENTIRLTAEKPLLARLKGKDEVAMLDNVFHDMAEALKEAQFAERAFTARIKESEERIRSIIQGLNASLIVTDRSGAITFINAATCEMFGYQSEELLGTQLSAVLPPEKGRAMSEHTQNLIKKSTGGILETFAQRKDGSQFPVEVSLSECVFAEGPRLVANILDVTERYEIQQMRQAFVAMVSHDLRTPLTSIQAYLDLIDMGKYGDVNEKIRTGASRASRNVSRLIKLINDLLDLEKMESGTIALTRKRTRLIEVIDESVEAVRGFADNNKVHLVAVAGAPDVEISADRERLIQVLVNILSNAIKFSPPSASIEISLLEHDDCVELRVKDYGRGVPAKFRDAIFEKYQQVEESDNKKKGGTGLGLPICKAIVEQHGGSIGVDSEEGKGSEFWFKLPKQEVVSDTVLLSDIVDTIRA